MSAASTSARPTSYIRSADLAKSASVAMMPARMAVCDPPVIIIKRKIVKIPEPMAKFTGKNPNIFIIHSETRVTL